MAGNREAWQAQGNHSMCPCGGEGMPAWPLSIPIHSHLWLKYLKIPGLNLFLQDKSYCRSLCGFPNFYFHFRAGRQLQGGGRRAIFLAKTWFNIDIASEPTSFVSFFVTTPSQCSSDRLFQEIPKTPATWEHRDIWACDTSVNCENQDIRATICDIWGNWGGSRGMSGEKGGEGREGEKRQRSRHSRCWWWILLNMIMN